MHILQEVTEFFFKHNAQRVDPSAAIQLFEI